METITVFGKKYVFDKSTVIIDITSDFQIVINERQKHYDLIILLRYNIESDSMYRAIFDEFDINIKNIESIIEKAISNLSHSADTAMFYIKENINITTSQRNPKSFLGQESIIQQNSTLRYKDQDWADGENTEYNVGDCDLFFSINSRKSTPLKYTLFLCDEKGHVIDYVTYADLESIEIIGKSMLRDYLESLSRKVTHIENSIKTIIKVIMN